MIERIALALMRTHQRQLGQPLSKALPLESTGAFRARWIEQAEAAIHEIERAAE